LEGCRMRKVWWMVGSVRRAVGMSDELSLSPPSEVSEGTEVTFVDRAWLKMYCKDEDRFGQ
jgi:hypothetical protein